MVCSNAYTRACVREQLKTEEWREFVIIKLKDLAQKFGYHFNEKNGNIEILSNFISLRFNLIKFKVKFEFILVPVFVHLRRTYKSVMLIITAKISPNVIQQVIIYIIKTGQK